MIIHMELRVSGWKQYRDGMYGLTGEVIGASKETLYEMALLVEANAKDFSPVKTGGLRSTIGHFDPALLISTNPDAVPANAIWEEGPDFIRLGTRIFYAPFVHALDPFLESALRQSMGDLQQMARDAAAEGINRSFGRRIVRTIGRKLRTILRRGR